MHICTTCVIHQAFEKEQLEVKSWLSLTTKGSNIE